MLHLVSQWLHIALSSPFRIPLAAIAVGCVIAVLVLDARDGKNGRR